MPSSVRSTPNIVTVFLIDLGWCVEGAQIVEICQKGDQMFEEELSKVYKGKKIAKGMPFDHEKRPSYARLRCHTDSSQASLILRPSLPART